LVIRNEKGILLNSKILKSIRHMYSILDLLTGRQAGRHAQANRQAGR